ncbi:MAG TPA: hypothetical protein DCM87_21090 [Planctomycetes bacterium]|nr:hypothetical protein [Planctomycetota bacterium]
MRSRNVLRAKSRALAAAWAACLSMQAAGAAATIFDFDTPASSGAWTPLNDGVMGGLSRSNARITGATTLAFTGEVSLENNGGFASIQSRVQAIDLRETSGLAARVRGDGKTYWMTLRTNVPIPAGWYQARIETAAGKWIEVRLPFDQFRATSFGRTLPGAPPLPRNAIESIGFLISDKQKGAFALEVDWIKAYASARLAAGDRAPAFTRPDQRGAATALADFEGKKVLVYFYPKADTPGCTAQACSVRDADAALDALGLEVLGVSPDQPDAQQKFDEKFSLGFRLLSDPDKTAARAYGAIETRTANETTTETIVRSAFLIDEQGVILKAWYKISPAEMVPEAMRALAR